MADLHLPTQALGATPHPPTDIVQLYRSILDYLPTRVGVYEIVDDADFRLVFMNRTALGGDEAVASQTIGKLIGEFLPSATADHVKQLFRACIDAGTALTVESSYDLSDGSTLWSIATNLPMRDTDGRITHVLNSWEDVTARKQRELEERLYQEAIIEQQAAALLELSTPLLAISEQVVIMPIVGAVDSSRAQKMTEALLNGIAASRAHVAILDITGVPVVDTQVANAFIQAAQGMQLLGASVIMTGIRPEVAQTLVGMGVDLRGIVTRGTLRDGIAHALKL